MFKKYTYLKLIATILIILGLSVTPGVASAQEAENSMPEVDSTTVNEVIYEESEQVYTRGKILEVKEIEDTGSEMIDKSLEAKVRVTEGEFKGEVLTIRHDFSGNPAFDFEIRKGDSVVLFLNVKDNQILQGFISDLGRDHYLFYLTVIFLVLIILVGKFKGLKAIITLAITVVAVIKVLLPAILQGYDPVLATVFVALGATALTLLIVGGFNMKSVAAIIGTMGGIILAGIIGKVVINGARLSGLSSEESAMLLYIPQNTNFDFTGLLFAGMIIGALGAVMDVGMSIASSIHEIHKANPKLTWWELTMSGLNVGKDIIGTMSNTLVLAYAGGSLPLLLVITAYGDPMLKILNLDMIATEIVRALAGSIGLVLAVPLTAFAAGYLVKLQGRKSELQ